MKEKKKKNLKEIVYFSENGDKIKTIHIGVGYRRGRDHIIPGIMTISRVGIFGGQKLKCQKSLSLLKMENSSTDENCKRNLRFSC